VTLHRAALILLGFCACVSASADDRVAHGRPLSAVRHVLLISIDGFHALDLANFVRSHPDSALAQLSATGITYTQAFTARPSDSFPGLMAMVTGGSPRSTGIWNEGTYSRSLSPPGSDCKVVGTEVIWDASINQVKKALDGGGRIDPAKLPLDPSKGCVPVYPHSYIRVNTIFEVIHSAGMRTAWIDKHLSFEMVNGPSGSGVDDLFTPEISSITAPKSDVRAREAYDDIKVQAILNEIGGKDHSGSASVGVPAIFGMSFQAVSQAQRIMDNGGYTDSSGSPGSIMLDALRHTDDSIGQMVSALKARRLINSTVIIVTAKHAQAPMDRSKRHLIDKTVIPNMIRQAGGLVADTYQDGTLASIWLTDPNQAGKVAEILSQPVNQSAAGIQQILWGESLKLMCNDPSQDERVPDIVIVPVVGYIYNDDALSAHGGFSSEDTNVGLLVSNPGLSRTTVKTPVETTQIAPTILTALGIDPNRLQAVRMEQTRVLPKL